MPRKTREERMAERRARLAEIKAKRANRIKKGASGGKASIKSPRSPAGTGNIDDLVSSLLRKEPAAAVKKVIQQDKERKGGAAKRSPRAGGKSTSAGPASSVSTFSAEAKLKTLKMSFQVGEVGFGSQAKVKYARASQTTDDLLTTYLQAKPRRSSVNFAPPRGSRTSVDMADAANAAEASLALAPNDEDEETKQDVPIWTNKQKQEAMSTPAFAQFMSRAGKISERAIFLNKTFDFMVEYGKTTNESNVEAEKIALHADLYVEKLCGSKTLTKIAWSPQYSELILGCYNTSASLGHYSSGSEPDGNVFIWSLNKPSVPEMKFTCQSPILTAEFHPHSPNLVIGGAYSGQIILWDMRSGHTPVQRTMSMDGHSLPVYSLQILGGKNLVSISTDGKLRLWDVNQLATPKVARNLCWPPKSEASENAVAVTAAALTHNENMITVGSESGQLYKVQILGANPGVQQSYTGHFGMVTDLHHHPLGDRSSLSHLILSSGIDWSVKLWNLHKSTNNMLRSFSSSTNYVFSARWSPIHPSLFASCDASGSLDFWDISQSMEVPVHTVVGDSAGRARACSSLRWAKDGRKIATGSLDGHIRVYDVKPALADPGPDAVAKLEANLHRINEQMNEEAAMAAAKASKKDAPDEKSAKSF